MEYRFLGSESDIGAITLRSFGQSVTLSEELAHDAIQGGCPLLPAEEFEAIGFTAEELKAFAKPGPRMNAPESFKAKVKSALAAVHAKREEWLAKAKADADASAHASAVVASDLAALESADSVDKANTSSQHNQNELGRIAEGK